MVLKPFEQSVQLLLHECWSDVETFSRAFRIICFIPTRSLIPEKALFVEPFSTPVGKNVGIKN